MPVLKVRLEQLFRTFGQHPLPEWAGEIGCANWAQFFLKFIVSHPAVTCAIPATSRVEHMQENMGALYGRLLRSLDVQGYRTMVGVIALPNAASVALHEACGFEHAGTLRRGGYKHGAWHDGGFWQPQNTTAAGSPGPLERKSPFGL